MDLCDIREIKSLLARHGFHFSKSMGQNFLIQSWVPRDIAAASGAGRRPLRAAVRAGVGQRLPAGVWAPAPARLRAITMTEPPASSRTIRPMTTATVLPVMARRSL